MDVMMINLAIERVMPILTYIWMKDNSGPNSFEFREKIYDIIEAVLDELGRHGDPPTRESVTRVISLIRKRIDSDQELADMPRIW